MFRDNQELMADSTIIYNHREDPEHPRLYGLATKNKATVTLYAVWDKVAPSKPAGYTASFANGKLTVKSNEILDTDTAYEIQYSTNMLFLGGNTSITLEYGDSINGEGFTAEGLYGSKYYVRIRKIGKDSTGAGVNGAWGPTVRASKATQ